MEANADNKVTAGDTPSAASSNPPSTQSVSGAVSAPITRVTSGMTGAVSKGGYAVTQSGSAAHSVSHHARLWGILKPALIAR